MMDGASKANASFAATGWYGSGMPTSKVVSRSVPGRLSAATQTLLLLLSKQGYREVALAELPEQARRQVVKSLPPGTQATFFVNTQTGQVSALIWDKQRPGHGTLRTWPEAGAHLSVS